MIDWIWFRVIAENPQSNFSPEVRKHFVGMVLPCPHRILTEAYGDKRGWSHATPTAVLSVALRSQADAHTVSLFETHKKHGPAEEYCLTGFFSDLVVAVSEADDAEIVHARDKILRSSIDSWHNAVCSYPILIGLEIGPRGNFRRPTKSVHRDEISHADNEDALGVLQDRQGVYIRILEDDLAHCSDEKSRQVVTEKLEDAKFLLGRICFKNSLSHMGTSLRNFER